MRERKQIILDAISDLVSSFLYYSRKEDEDLPVGEIEAAISAEEITVEEIVGAFASKIRGGLED